MPNKKTLIVYLSAFLFILGNVLFIVREQYFFSLLPVALIVIYLTVFSLDKLLYLLIFLTPLSIPIREFFPGIPNDIGLPAEPLLFGILLIFVFKLLFEKNFDKRILYHPISLAIYLNIFWMLLTSITSTMPVVSFKFLLSRLWFLAGYYFMAAHLFNTKKSIYTYFYLYSFSFLFVIFYTLYQHSKFGFFDQQAANWVVSPLLPDHTSYAAIIAMLIPFVIGTLSLRRIGKITRLALWVLLGILLTGLVFSYTRAAWVGIVGAIGIAIVMLLRIKFKWVFIIGLSLITLTLSFRTELLIMLEQNNQDSSDNFTEQIQSMSNISTDASNLERINRWHSALRMFQEKPIMGFGPGTYMFQYAPYQFSYEKTIISTNFSDGGNAHSEYLSALSESGVLGALSFLLIVILTSYTAIKIYSDNKNYEIRMLATTAFLGLVTYYLHGVLNNFLDIDKTSALFWGYTALIMAVDVYFHKNPANQEACVSEQNQQINNTLANGK